MGQHHNYRFLWRTENNLLQDGAGKPGVNWGVSVQNNSNRAEKNKSPKYRWLELCKQSKFGLRRWTSFSFRCVAVCIYYSLKISSWWNLNQRWGCWRLHVDRQGSRQLIGLFSISVFCLGQKSKWGEEFCLRKPASTFACSSSDQCTWYNVDRMNARYFAPVNPHGAARPMRQSSSLTLRRHITGMPLIAGVDFINHWRRAELLWKPNIYTQTKPSPSAHCSWVAARRFWKWVIYRAVPPRV